MVGRNLTDALIKGGHDVYGVSMEKDNPNINHVVLDLRDKEATRILIEQVQPDIIYHLAANAAESRGQISPIDMTERNLNIFLHVLVPAINIGVKRFIYTSSVAVYGDAPVPYSEEDTPIPKDVYGVNKYACERILQILGKVHGFKYTIFRPHNIYGPHQDMSNPYKNVVALFMRNLLEDRECKIFGEGKMERAFSFVEDVVKVLVESMDDPKFENQVVNVGSAIETTIGELLSMVEEVAGKKAKRVDLPARPQEILRFLAKRRKLDTLTQYHETPLREGLEKTWRFINLPPIKEEANELHTH